MAILILGPSKWRRGYRPSLPEWVAEYLPERERPTRGRVLSPLGVRRALVSLLERAGCHATLMELHQRQAGETYTGLFHRLVRELPVDRFLLYWPYGSQRPGLDVELGFLLTRLEDGVSLDVRVLVEAGAKAAGKIGGGDFVSLEPGRRTHYYEDLIEYRCHVVEWEDYSALCNAILRHGTVDP